MAKKQTTALASWDDKLAALGAKRQKAVAQFQGGGRLTKINHGRGVLKAGKTQLPGNEGQFAVLDVVAHNTFYDPAKEWVEGAKDSPICYAFGIEGGDMAPHPASSRPQAEKCATCKWNQWGSQLKGSRKGKQCSNKTRLLLVASNDTGRAQEAEVYYLDVPPTSGQNLSRGFDMLDAIDAKIGSLLIGVTRETGSAAQYALTFTKPQAVSKDDLPAVFGLLEDLGPDPLVFPYAAPSEEEDGTRSVQASTGEGAPSVTKKSLKGRGKY